MAKKLQILGNIVDVAIDPTLSVEGASADAKVTGDAINSVKALVGNKPVSEQISDAMLKGNVDLTGYATETYVDDAVAAIDYPVDSVNGKTGAVILTASDVGALPDTTTIPSVEGLASESYVETSLSAHNTNTAAHNDIQDLIFGLTTRLNALADSDDTTLDQMSEIVAYIKSNKSLIDSITTNKVNVSDIVNNLITNVSNKPLSAAQGVALKALIDAISVPTKVSELANDKGYITGYTETDPTVPSWAKSSTKPTYSKSEVGLGNVDNVKQYSASNPPPYPVKSVAGKTGDVTLAKLSITGAVEKDYDGTKDVTVNIPSHQIIAIATDSARLALSSPVSGSYYFVEETSVLWTYRSGAWVRIAAPSAEIANDIKAVSYSAQNLTEDQKAQARANIGAVSSHNHDDKYQPKGDYLTSVPAEYVTDTELAASNAQLIDALVNEQTLIDNVAERVPYVKTAEQPTFVDSVDEMTDTSKMYVLKSDAEFYSYKAHTTTIPGSTVANFTNQVPLSTDTDGSIFNGVGYKENVRLSSSGGISSSAQNGSVTTGFMPFHGDGDVIRIKGVDFVTLSEGGKHYYIIFYDANKKSRSGSNDYIASGQLVDGIYDHIVTTTKDENGVETITFNQAYGTTNSLLQWIRSASYFRITAKGKGADMIVTVNEEIAYTTTEGGTETTYTWGSTGISYNQPADYEDRVVIAEADINRLKNQSADLTHRVANLEENGVAADGSGDDESCYNVQMNKLYADSIIQENTALNNALETLCNRRDGSTQSKQVIKLKNNEKQKLILHLHKRENDGYDTVNDAYLPNAQNDFSDVRITTDSGETLKYQIVYSGNIDVISDSRIGNSDVSFLSDGNGYIYIQKDGYVVKSTDAGKTWSKITSINTQLSSSVNQLSYVCEDGTLFFAAKNFSLLYKSTPPYSSIKQVLDVSEGGTYTGNAIRPFQFVQLPTGEMLIGSYQSQFAPRIWKSTDNGDSWRQVYFGTDPKYQHVHRMTVDPYQNPVAIYAGLDRGWGHKTLDPDTGKYYNESGCVLRSTDGGETWINLYEDQRGKPSTVDHGVTYVDPSGYRLLGGETGICGGHSIIRTTDDVNFVPVLNEGHAVYGPEKLNGYIIAGGCGSNGGKNAAIFMSDDEGITWKQIYSEEPTLSNDIASAGIKTFLKGTFAGTDYEQLIGHNMITEVDRPSKRIISNDNSWYAEIIVDVPNGTNSITVESGYMCPNLAAINNDTENVGDAVFVMDFNENGKYLKEKVSGEIYKGDHVFRGGGKHLGYIYPDVKSAIDMNAIKLNSPIFDTGIQKRLNLDAPNGVVISFWLLHTVNSDFEIVRNGSNALTFDGVNIRCNGYNLGAIMTTEGGRFVKVDLVVDGANNTIKAYENGICVYSTTEQTKLDIVTSLLTGEKDYVLLKRSSDDDITAIQHFEIRHGAPTGKEVYDSYFSRLTDNY